MRTSQEELIKKMQKAGFMINPFKDKYYSFKIVINNCKETTYYFVESKDPFSEEDVQK